MSTILQVSVSFRFLPILCHTPFAYVSVWSGERDKMAAPLHENEINISHLDVKLAEVHFHKLDIPKGHPNVYGLTKICSSGTNDNRLLVASIRGGITSVECRSDCDETGAAGTGPSQFDARDVHFTYIPGDAKIVSIDSFNKGRNLSGVVIGITFVKSSNEMDRASGETRSQFLNIYSDWKLESTEFDLNSIAEGCFNLKLDFMPFQLTHTELISPGVNEFVFLLSGSDNRVHMYKEDKIFDYHTFIEQPIEEYFPEFQNIPSSILWLDILYFAGKAERVTAYGCEDGYLCVSLVRVADRVVCDSWSLYHDGPITTVKLFTSSTPVEMPAVVSAVHAEDYNMESSQNAGAADESRDIHLLVTAALEVSVVYRDVVNRGLSYQTILAESSDSDSVLCSCVADVDFDGENELILGTYGQKLMVYKYQHPDTPSAPSSRKTSASSRKSSNESSPSNGDVDPPSPHHRRRAQGHYNLVWERNFAFPIFAIDSLDLTRDGMEEIVVLSYKGLHILQHDLQETARLVLSRLTRLCRRNSECDAFAQLQSEILDNEEEATEAEAN